MKINIKQIKCWLSSAEDEHSVISYPKPQYYPKAQLRRLSPFSKVALECLDFEQALHEGLSLVFASRHGDLAKTVELIKDIATNDDLSPTQFALSVHNATSGLFTIARNNKSATTTISAGENTFIEGFVEASMQATLENKDVLYLFCEFPVPIEYAQFSKNEIPHAIALVVGPGLDTGLESEIVFHDSDGPKEPGRTIDIANAVLNNNKQFSFTNRVYNLRAHFT